MLLAVFYQPPRVDAKGLSYGQRLGQIDWIGCTLFAGGILLVLVGLTIGGAEYPWSGAPTVATLVIGFAMLVALAGHQLFVKRDGIFRKVRQSYGGLTDARRSYSRTATLRYVSSASSPRALRTSSCFCSATRLLTGQFNSYYGVQVGTLWDATTFGLALRFCAFVWAAAVASLVYIVIAYRYRAIKELMIWGCVDASCPTALTGQLCRLPHRCHLLRDGRPELVQVFDRLCRPRRDRHLVAAFVHLRCRPCVRHLLRRR